MTDWTCLQIFLSVVSNVYTCKYVTVSKYFIFKIFIFCMLTLEYHLYSFCVINYKLISVKEINNYVYLLQVFSFDLFENKQETMSTTMYGLNWNTWITFHEKSRVSVKLEWKTAMQ